MSWNEFVWVMKIFWGKKKSWFGCNVSIKLHFLLSHLEHSFENLGYLSEEQGKCFHQGIRTMEERYQGYINTNSSYKDWKMGIMNKTVQLSIIKDNIIWEQYCDSIYAHN